MEPSEDPAAPDPGVPAALSDTRTLLELHYSPGFTVPEVDQRKVWRAPASAGGESATERWMTCCSCRDACVQRAQACIAPTVGVRK